MLETNKKLALGGVLLVAVLIGIALVTRPTITTLTDTTIPTASSSVTRDGISGTGNFTVSPEEIPTVDIPDFRASIRFGPNISSEERAALQKAAETLSERIAKDQFDLSAWINLGTVRKIGDDFKGAETAWVFVTKVAPNDSLAYNNLGDLHMNFLKDYAKAEQAYLTAIKLSPAEAGAYQALSQLYTNFYKVGTTAAEDILKKGIATHPDSIDMHVVLARYYKERGQTAEAKAQYEAAIVAADKSGQPEAAAQLRAEENQL